MIKVMNLKKFVKPPGYKTNNDIGLQDTIKVTKYLNVYLESHVLQEEACSIVLLIFIATASTDPQSNLRQWKKGVSNNKKFSRLWHTF